MKTPKMLYNVLNVIIYLILIAFVIGFVLIAMTLLGSKSNLIASNALIEFKNHAPGIYIFMALNTFVYAVFVFGLLQFKRATKLLLDINFYDIELSKNVNLAGKCFVISGVFWWLFDGLSSIHFKGSISIGVGEKTFIYLFIIAIGLFMMLMSTIFNNARDLKQENDLTI